jgi:hypothetical protein
MRDLVKSAPDMDGLSIAAERARRIAAVSARPDPFVDKAHPSFLCDHNERKQAYEDLVADLGNIVSYSSLF